MLIFRSERVTDAMGCMHSDAQFAGSSSVPAHVEMMGFLGILLPNGYGDILSGVSLLGYETAGNFAGIMLAVRRILGGPGAFRP